jgi:hypothetical protein
MYLYGQYCPVARASEILADRWTPLIVRELLAGLRHFNDLDRGLPGISRALLVERLRRLERMGIAERRASADGRAVEYATHPRRPRAPAGHRPPGRVGRAVGIRRSETERAGPRRSPLVDEAAGPQAAPSRGPDRHPVRLPRGAKRQLLARPGADRRVGVPPAPEVRRRPPRERGHRRLLPAMARAHDARRGHARRPRPDRRHARRRAPFRAGSPGAPWRTPCAPPPRACDGDGVGMSAPGPARAAAGSA